MIIVFVRYIKILFWLSKNSSKWIENWNTDIYAIGRTFLGGLDWCDTIIRKDNKQQAIAAYSSQLHTHYWICRHFIELLNPLNRKSFVSQVFILTQHHTGFANFVITHVLLIWSNTLVFVSCNYQCYWACNIT